MTNPTDKQLAERMAEALENIEGRIATASDWFNDSTIWNDDGTAVDGNGTLTDWILKEAKQALAAYKEAREQDEVCGACDGTGRISFHGHYEVCIRCQKS